MGCACKQTSVHICANGRDLKMHIEEIHTEDIPPPLSGTNQANSQAIEVFKHLTLSESN